MGFTSAYLRDLVTGYWRTQPRCARVFCSGLSESWLARAREPMPPWEGRPLELLSVSNVHPYKRQYLVVQALPKLVQRPGMKDLIYRIVGAWAPEVRGQIENLAQSLGGEENVVVPGRLRGVETRHGFRQAG